MARIAVWIECMRPTVLALGRPVVISVPALSLGLQFEWWVCTLFAVLGCAAMVIAAIGSTKLSRLRPECVGIPELTPVGSGTRYLSSTGAKGEADSVIAIQDADLRHAAETALGTTLRRVETGTLKTNLPVVYIGLNSNDKVRSKCEAGDLPFRIVERGDERELVFPDLPGHPRFVSTATKSYAIAYLSRHAWVLGGLHADGTASLAKVFRRCWKLIQHHDARSGRTQELAILFEVNRSECTLEPYALFLRPRGETALIRTLTGWQA